MENLPIDAKSLPSRIFHSETEDKFYVGEPGDYKEVGGGDILPSEEGKFLVGGATDWEKRGITGSDFTLSTIASGNRIPVFSTASQAWVNNGYNASESPSVFSVPIRTNSPNSGRLKANNAIENNDLVPLGQLNTILENLELPADQVSYDNTASGLLAETVQEAIDELSEHIVELYDKKLDRVETGSTERVYAVSELNNQSMIPTMEQFVSDTAIISALEAITTDIATISVPGKTMYKGQLYVSDSPAYIYLAYDDNQIIRK